MGKNEVMDRIERARVAFGLQQNEFIRRIGIKENAYSNYKKRDKGIPVPVALRIRKEYGLTLDFIYAGDISTLRHDLVEKLRDVA